MSDDVTAKSVKTLKIYLTFFYIFVEITNDAKLIGQKADGIIFLPFTEKNQRNKATNDTVSYKHNCSHFP